MGRDGHPPEDGARGGAQPGPDGRPARRLRAGADGDRREPRLASGGRVGAGARPSGGAALRRDVACRGNRRLRLRGGVPPHGLRPGGGPARPGVADGGAGLDPGRHGRRQLPARRGGAACGPARRLLLPHPQRQRPARRDRVLHRRAARGRRRAPGDHGQPGRPDRPGGRAPARRGGVEREGGEAPRHARRRARLRGDHGPRGRCHRLQPRGRAHFRLPRPRTWSGTRWRN